MTSLRQRMIEDMQIRNLAVHTQNTYVLQVSMFARHFSKSPEILGPEEIRTYQVYLTNEKKLAITSILIAICVSVRCVPALRIDSEVIVAFRLGCWFDGVRQSGGDVPREELVDAVDGMIGDASQHLV